MSESMTTAQVAAHFGVNTTAVLKWVYGRKLPAIRTLGGHWRFDADQVAAFAPPRQPGVVRGCDSQGCERRHHGLGLCKKHYKQARRPGHSFDLDDSGEL